MLEALFILFMNSDEAGYNHKKEHTILFMAPSTIGPWPALDVVVEGRGGKLCLSPEIQSLGEDELLALTTEFCTEARIGEHGCAYHVLGLILVFLGKEAVAKQVSVRLL